mmetsp:Transcript_55601/g.129441  ORF Transcript_55601/g.129441 Transcript_55601/m.129441 type:complete len:137 (-) Transcript_55601:114-524(-)
MGDTLFRCCGSNSVYDAGVKLYHEPIEAPVIEGPSRSQDGFESTYTLRLDRTEGKAMGMKADHLTNGVLLVSAIIPDGLIHEWNIANPSCKVREGDRILEVNGSRGDVNFLIQECHKLQVLEIKLARSRNLMAVRR